MDHTQSHELDLLFDNRPNAFRNPLYVFILYLVVSISGLISLSAGISLLIDSARTQLLTGLGLAHWLSPEKLPVVKNFGILFSGLGFALLIAGILCRIIGKNNQFIQELFTWHEGVKQEAKQKSDAA